MARLLDRIEHPGQLKGLSVSELASLAAELRGTIIDTVSRHGGHLAASLGVVELTIALHRVFKSPADKLIWDVGHQAYAHKLLTGRRDRFETLRQAGGLAGFPRRDESVHDPFGTGHASTSISAALGLAKARDLSGGSHSVVAVIGDGALTGGLAFEGLNHAGQDGTALVVVLNDNRMSIAQNVGALSRYLSRLRAHPAYYRVKTDLGHILHRVPLIGPGAAAWAARVKDSIKYLVVPGALFEELGFTYLGPLDGHDIGQLEAALSGARQMGGPVLVHVVTQKGKGFRPAENQPQAFHGVGPFHVDTGERLNLSNGLSYSEVFGDTMVELGARDGRLVAITAAMPEGTGLASFGERFPGRLFDVGIAEGHAVTFAAGLAAAGLRPVVAIYSTFAQRAYDQLVHDVALQGLPVVLALDRAGLAGEDGPTHHGAFDLAFFRQIPGFTVMAPRDGDELRDMLAAAVALPGPVAIRYPRDRTTPSGRPLKALPLTGDWLRDGRDLGILAIGSMVKPSLAAAGLLEARGISAAVFDARYVSPLDSGAIVGAAQRFELLLTVEEGTLAGGFGSAVLECLVAAGHEPKVSTLGLDPDRFAGQGTRGELLTQAGLDPEGIARSALLARDRVQQAAPGRRDR